ncbi:MAG: hypothetical protein Q7S75_01325 [bacterium]|nr:hypothetical protein [bacterium]
MNNKNTLIAAVTVLILLGLGATFYFYQQPKTDSNNVQTGDSSFAPQAPLENKPDLNPVDKANPFKGVKTNPFE